MRLDKYLKVSRLIKRRTVANEACDSGRVLINDKPAKASANVKEGDIISISFGNKEVKVEVLDVQETVKKKKPKNFSVIYNIRFSMYKFPHFPIQYIVSPVPEGAEDGRLWREWKI